jgi:phosphopantothenoylcysteine decarboxylase / phosphopantothenate---cysteine ligase
VALVGLGVSGGIGAYKAVEVARGLQKADHEVVAIMTRAARTFVGPLTFEAITRRRVITNQFAPGANADIEHISLATDIALLVVVPATANVIAKFAHGIADDFLTSLYLATRAPVLMAPAMNTNMLEHEATRRNLDVLAARGVRFVQPGEGYLACGWIGKGRLAEPDEIVAAADAILRGPQTLAGRTVLVTAGPTYEDIDPVRYIGNRSSGRMGYAIAAEAAARGARTILVTGPTTIPEPAGAAVHRVRCAADMHRAVMDLVPGTDIVIMAAAVADYAPAGGPADQKIHKDRGDLTVTLTRTPDILGDLGRLRAGARRPLLVGFAAETSDVVASAREKLRRKRVDVIVANDVSRAGSGFDAPDNEVTFVTADDEESLLLRPKRQIASALMDRIERLLGAVERPAPAL